MVIAEHPDRAAVLKEIHARPFNPLRANCRLLHFAFVVESEAADVDWRRIEILSSSEGGSRVEANARHVVLRAGRLKWERHGEFVTYTFQIEPEDAAAWPSDLVAPGLLIVAVDLNLSTADSKARPYLITTPVVGGEAIVSSDFKPNESGFVAIRVTDCGMSEELAGATVQRLLELETYRCLALLGLPVARAATISIGQIEAELPRVMARMDAATGLEDNQKLLDQLSSMSLDLEKSSAATHYRFAATRAYAELVRLRLDALRECQNQKSSSLFAFFGRRFDPAIRTCMTVADREAVLSRKLTGAVQLLRTRVEIALQRQNRDLLTAMNERVQLQLRLQHTVEGLSIAAISYYVISLTKLILDGVSKYVPTLEAGAVTAGLTPVILLAVGVIVVRIRRRHLPLDA